MYVFVFVSITVVCVCVCVAISLPLGKTTVLHIVIREKLPVESSTGE